MRGTIDQWQEQTGADANNYAAAYHTLAANDFATFRRCMRPDMVWGSFTIALAEILQEFYEDLKDGKRPKLALMSPPQHGKSWAVTDFIAWIAGKLPDWRTIFASYSDELGIKTSLELQRMMKTEVYRSIFPHMHIDQFGWQCNTMMIEYVEKRGSFRNTTVEGAINGMGLHLGIIDDPVKGSREAASKLKPRSHLGLVHERLLRPVRSACWPDHYYDALAYG
jgi:hypothetical protein